MASLRLILDESRDGQAQMTVDEMLFRESIQKNRADPILRFYRFSPPAVTVGYGMWRDYSVIARSPEGTTKPLDFVVRQAHHPERSRGARGEVLSAFCRSTKQSRNLEIASLPSVARNDVDSLPLVRRLTGGGVVRHEEDLIYSLVIPPAVSKQLGTVRESYKAIHIVLIQALGKFGLVATLYGQERAEPSSPLAGEEEGGGSVLCLPPHPDLPPRRGEGDVLVSAYCFDAPVLFDVMLGSVKIAGAGQKRLYQYCLQQGSLDWKRLSSACARLSEHEFALEFASKLATFFGMEMKESVLNAEELKAAEHYRDGYARAAV